jgi:hypothetical protein
VIDGLLLEKKKKEQKKKVLNNYKKKKKRKRKDFYVCSESGCVPWRWQQRRSRCISSDSSTSGILFNLDITAGGEKIVYGRMHRDSIEFRWLLLQEKAARLAPIEEIRTVLDHSVRGMLSTFSQVFETPF